MGQHVAHEVDAARCQLALSTLATVGLDALVGIGHDQLNAAQAAAGEFTRERRPERLGFRGANIHAENFAPAVTFDADRDDHRDRYDAAVLAHLHADMAGRPRSDGRQTPSHFVVDLAAPPADLALGDAGNADRLHQIVHRTGRDALHVGFLHHGGERLLGHASRLQEAREVGAALECAVRPRRHGSPRSARGNRYAWPDARGFLAIGRPGLSFAFQLRGQDRVVLARKTHAGAAYITPELVRRDLHQVERRASRKRQQEGMPCLLALGSLTPALPLSIFLFT